MNCKSLYISNVHTDVTEAQLRQKFSVVGEISSVKIHNKKGQCFAYVNFLHSDDAAEALSTMNNDPVKGLPIKIQFNKFDPSLIGSHNANIIIKKLDKSKTSKDLRNLCSLYGNIVSLKIVSDENGSKGYAYVNYGTLEEANQAITRLNGRQFGKTKMKVEKFIPIDQRESSSKEKEALKPRQRFLSGGSLSIRRVVSESNLPATILNESDFVEKSPSIIDQKLRYLKSLLCGKCKDYCNKKINNVFDNANAKGRLAALNGRIILVTKTEEAHIDCCKVLNELIHCSKIELPKDFVESEIDIDKLVSAVKSQKLKYFGISLVNNVIEIGSFNKDDLHKGKEAIEKLLEGLQHVSLFACDEQDAKLFHKNFLSGMRCQLSIVPEGLKLVGSTFDVFHEKQVLSLTKTYTRDYEYSEPKISLFFKSDQWKQFRDSLEDDFQCVVTVLPIEVLDNRKQSSPFSLLPDFYVYQGRIEDDNSDVIVNGVSNNFDLSWGKISPAILSKAGKDIENECKSRPLFSTQYMRATSGGNLCCKYIFHIVTPSSSDQLTKRFKAVLERAATLGAESISFPTLGAGGIGLDPLDVALAMQQAFQEYFFENLTTQRLFKAINVVVFEPALVNVFKEHSTPPGASERKNLKPSHKQVVFSQKEKYVVRVTALNKTNLDKVFERLTTLRSRIFSTVEITENVASLEENELGEIRQLSLQHGVTIEILNESSSKLIISGLEEEVDKVKKKIDDILHDLVLALLVAQVCTWTKEEKNGKFTPFPTRTSSLIETNFKKSPVASFPVSVCGSRYKINLKEMKYEVDGFDGMLKSGKVVRETVSIVSDVPSNWAPMNGQSVLKHKLLSNSTEYLTVQQQIQSRGFNYSIVKIERIQNPVLYKQYQIKKNDVEQNMNSFEPAERELFHGTSSEDAEKICCHGFDRNFAGRNAAAYGRGTYFAVRPSYSFRFCTADVSGFKCMFLAQVLTGNYCKGDPSFVAPPPIGFGPNQRKYDSVVDHSSAPSIFAVFRDSSVYPKYLITFQ